MYIPPPERAPTSSPVSMHSVAGAARPPSRRPDDTVSFPLLHIRDSSRKTDRSGEHELSLFFGKKVDEDDEGE